MSEHTAEKGAGITDAQIEWREQLGQRLMLTMTCQHGSDYFGTGAVCETCFANVQRIGHLIERIAAQAWDQGRAAERRDWEFTADLSTPDEDRQSWTNPYRVTPPAETEEPAEKDAGRSWTYDGPSHIAADGGWHTGTADSCPDCPPIADGERIWIAGEPVWVRYDPDLTVDGEPRYGCADMELTGLNSVEVKPYGALQEVTHVQPGQRRVIRLRRWDERVFLHEVLHILLGKHYPYGQHDYDHTFVKDPKHEKAVREIEDGLWDMGWRLFDGRSLIDPTIERIPDGGPDA